MTSVIFKKTLNLWDDELPQKILLLVDSHAVYPSL